MYSQNECLLKNTLAVSGVKIQGGGGARLPPPSTADAHGSGLVGHLLNEDIGDLSFDSENEISQIFYVQGTRKYTEAISRLNQGLEYRSRIERDL